MNIEFENIVVRQGVDRKIPSNIRVIQVMLYACCLFSTLMGTTEGFLWLIPSLGSLLLCWYMMGEARVNYEYRLDGYILTVMRTSGMRSIQKTVEFLKLDLHDMKIMAEEGLSLLDAAEKESAAATPKRITYDVSAHDRDKGCYVIYAKGMGSEEGRALRVYISPGAEMRNAMRMLCPGKVHLSEE